MTPALPARSRAIVLFSGGQDSTTCVAWALARFESVETIGFDYGQRHAVELQCRAPVLAGLRAMRPEWSRRLGADHLLDLKMLGQISETALTRDTKIVFERNGLPSTFVPGRNLIFLNFAAATAYRRGAGVLVGGMCETDFSGYPDCRDNTIKATQVALSLGLDAPMVIETPLMWIDKAATWRLAHTLGGDALIELIREHTHTCYLGERTTRHPWGYGCAHCPACELRARGYQSYLEQKHTSAPLALR
jgi:7-cyano-7-deazaguanine synthase